MGANLGHHDLMSGTGWDFSAQLWRHGQEEGSWHFATLPPNTSEEIRELAGPRKGFGAVKVSVELGESHWSTSLFPDAASGCYVLPVKKAVRLANDCEAGETIAVRVELVDR